MNKYISFREIDVSDAVMILHWRTSPGVTRFMNTDVEFNVEKQESWIKACRSKPDYYHWIIEMRGKPVGFVSIAGIASESMSWGLYLGEAEASGLGGLIASHLYNYAFKKLGMDKIFAEVFYNNINVIRLHQIHGYHFLPEKDRIIRKASKEILLVAMILNRAEWLQHPHSRIPTIDFPVALWENSEVLRRERFCGVE